MNVEEILEMWKEDSKINEIDLDLTSTETPKGRLFELTAARVCSPFFSKI